MAYVKILYQDSPSTATPMNAQNLNHMDDQIALNDQRLTEIETSYVKSFKSRTGDVGPEKGDYDINQINATDGQDGYVPVWRNSGTEQEPNWGFEMEAQGGAGHVLVDSDGNDMPSEDRMQFADAFLSDDDVNGKTVVENIKEVLPADYDSTTDEGIIVTDDGDDALIGPASDDKVEVTADGVKTYGQLFNELYAEIDATKLSEASYIEFLDSYYRLVLVRSSKYYFERTVNLNTHLYADTIQVGSSDSKIVIWDIKSNGNTQSDISSTVSTIGEKITLYYGNKKATVDLQTTANRCVTSDGGNVQQKLDSINNTLAQELYEEHTTREDNFVTSNIVDVQNASFLTEGYYTIVKNHKQITVRIAGISSKTNYDDWIIGLKNGYKPAKDEYFTYCLGTSTYHGHVTPEGYIRFQGLNTTDVLSATITFNIA